MEKNQTKNLLKRPPIVVVMGHVDHGKTTLLDYIRKTNVAGREAGGITQSIGAYEIVHPPAHGQKITFIDTPGHEAFSKMRAYGAWVADLAILIVAADDSVKPQTKEALQYIREAKLPFVVAINKIDKQNADVQKTKQDLTQNEVFLEGFGGDTSWQTISAKTGEGVNELLDLILLSAELENLTYDPDGDAAGLILSGRSDSRRGILVSAIIKNGKLQIGRTITTPSARGKIRFLEDFTGKKVNALEPSAPALILGFENLPQVGEEFLAAEKLLQEFKPTQTAKPPETEIPSTEEKSKLGIILKSDEVASLEVLKDLMLKISQEIPLKITEASIGNIHENDVKLALSAEAVIIGFKTKIDKAAQNMAKAKKILIINSPIIYELEKQIKDYCQKIALKEVRSVEVLAVFGKPKGKERIVGGRVIFGPVKNQEKFEIWSGTKMIGTGKILNLQSQKKDTPQVETGAEAGLLVESEEPVKIGVKLLFP